MSTSFLSPRRAPTSDHLNDMQNWLNTAGGALGRVKLDESHLENTFKEALNWYENKLVELEHEKFDDAIKYKSLLENNLRSAIN
jgi:hypothetical protein